MDLIGLFSAFLFFTVGLNCVALDFQKPIFATKTPYFWTQNMTEDITEDEYSTINYNGQKCQLSGLNVLFRHGARFPTLSWIQKMDTLHATLKRDNTVVKMYPFMLNWTNPFKEDQEGLLSPLGEDEMVKLGERFSLRYITVLKHNIHNIEFTVTHKARTKTSFENFYKGLNNTFHSRMNRPVPKTEDEKLRFYDTCPKYSLEVEHNDKAQVQYNDFMAGHVIVNMTEKIKNKLGFSSLTTADVLLFQQYCGFELGLYGKSEWCQFFELDDLLAIDYLNNIKKYYEYGYGYDINWQQSCPFTSDVFRTFDHIVQGTVNQNSKYHKIQMSFGHAETLLPVYAAFGLFQDTKPLLANDYHPNRTRLFSTSTIAPFSANLEIGLYNCGASIGHVMQISVNEKPIQIPGCQNQFCLYGEARKYYSNLWNCNFKQLCAIDEGHTAVG